MATATTSIRPDPWRLVHQQQLCQCGAHRLVARPRQRDRRRSAYHLQPDRRPDSRQSGRHRRRAHAKRPAAVVPAAAETQRGTEPLRPLRHHAPDTGRHDAARPLASTASRWMATPSSAQRFARRRPVVAVQRLDDDLRPVLRPRPRSRRQGRQRHVYRAALSRTIRSTSPGGQTTSWSLTRVTVDGPGADGISARPTTSPARQNITTTPWVDQNQTYASTARSRCSCANTSPDADGKPIATGHAASDRQAEWRPGDLGRHQGAGRDVLGIELTDADVGNIPLIAHRRVRQLHPRREWLSAAGRRHRTDGMLGTADDVLREGNRRGHCPSSSRQRRVRPHRPRLPRRHRACNAVPIVDRSGVSS